MDLLATKCGNGGSSPPVAVREYNIAGTRYIVRATVKAGASEDARAKVRRLIRNEVSQTTKECK